MAERLNVTDSKSVVVATRPGVQIPPSPPFDALRVASLAHGRPNCFMTLELPNGLKSVECPEPVEGLSWVYILFCVNRTFYVGQSHDIRKRLARHSNGSGARHTRQLKDFQLVYVEGPMFSDAAVSRERQLKGWSHAKKVALILGDKEKLKELSRSKD